MEIKNASDYKNNWNALARDILNVRLDPQQQQIVEAIQNNRRVSVRSGNARGKDFLAAVSSLCFLLTNRPSKVVNTAPTGRQVSAIMMAEISRIVRNAKIDLGVEVLSNRVKVKGYGQIYDEWYLIAFKAADRATEAWTGFHSPNILVVVSEASGIEQMTYNGIESILTGNSRLLLVFNPNQATGESYLSTKSPQYKHFHLNCLDAPNVVAKKIIYPGQVDWEWINERVNKPGWTMQISPDEAIIEDGDFCWDGVWYRPGNLFRVKVQGLYPKESDDRLIPLAWIEAANRRWEAIRDSGDNEYLGHPLRLGVDVAGMGRDLTVFCHRYDDYVREMPSFAKQDHMVTAGKVKQCVVRNIDQAFLDEGGEGAAIQSRLEEQGVNSVGVKNSENARGLTDLTESREFINMRAYLWWAMRDALDPQLGGKLALPPIDELTQDLNEPKYVVQSNGKIKIEEKEQIKKRIGRSPDFGDALSLTFYPQLWYDFADEIVKNEPREAGGW